MANPTAFRLISHPRSTVNHAPSCPTPFFQSDASLEYWNRGKETFLAPSEYGVGPKAVVVVVVVVVDRVGHGVEGVVGMGQR